MPYVSPVKWQKMELVLDQLKHHTTVVANTRESYLSTEHHSPEHQQPGDALGCISQPQSIP
uniref:Uncharacterized protein n=1 Tax=Malurus cyaneus samueli TaxID=2593467 RepID=A0A8C5TBF2_9PASS